MLKENKPEGRRSLLAGKIVSNFGQSTINCIVRRISDEGATLRVENFSGIPKQFQLSIVEEDKLRPCKLLWQSEKDLGVAFEVESVAESKSTLTTKPAPLDHAGLTRGPMLALRAAFDEIEIGIVLLDSKMRAQFINNAFRRMWRVPDALAASNPSFVTLMYHGCNTGAYELSAEKLDAYVAERVSLVQSGEMRPTNLRQSNGQVLQLQCAVLPNGGRMLSYTAITEIVRRSDELEGLRSALENIDEGIVLLDSDFKVQF